MFWLVYLQPVPTCTRGFETRYMQIQCNTNRPTLILLSSHNQPEEHSTRQCVPTVTVASRFVWAPSSLSSCFRSCCYHTARPLFSSGSSLFCYYCTTQLSRHATQRCDIAQYRVGRRRRQIFQDWYANATGLHHQLSLGPIWSLIAGEGRRVVTRQCSQHTACLPRSCLRFSLSSSLFSQI